MPEGEIKKDYTNVAVLALCVASLLIVLFIVTKLTNRVQVEVWVYELDLWITATAPPLALAVVIFVLWRFVPRRITIYGVEGSAIPYSIRTWLLDYSLDDSEVVLRISGYAEPIVANRARFVSRYREYALFPGIDGVYLKRKGKIILESPDRMEVMESLRKDTEIERWKAKYADAQKELVERGYVVEKLRGKEKDGNRPDKSRGADPA